ncbi:coatomer epsilon subunit domain-containing protein [Rhizoctonia solani]|uniref:Coatomer epsilon subunit domain-containing protein n=1 Tax=Rhizoctonia solani TaxID=456999 RepID=A0A8H8P4S1_9AGAM|nr:coatomer epsilon subunit domain-containing protein [Rhizoctonia solani]QRW24633.1 coatomer epsilon subunit domain-containing protein [Rhizoctonia solani]
MDSAYSALTANPLPDENSPDYLQTLLYTARSHIALGDTASALAILPETDSEPSVKADSATALEELRDASLEVEGEEGPLNGVVKVVAATAFLREGEVEEALTTLGAGTGTKDIECAALTVQAYLSINQIHLAKKEYELAKKHADDTLLIQLVEAALGLATGGTGVTQASYIYTEQSLLLSSSSNPSIIAAKGIAHLLKGQLPEAEADFAEAERVGKSADAAVGRVVVTELSGKPGAGEEQFNDLTQSYPDHPYVKDVLAKSELFDEIAAKFTVSTAA